MLNLKGLFMQTSLDFHHLALHKKSWRKFLCQKPLRYPSIIRIKKQKHNKSNTEKGINTNISDKQDKNKEK